MTITKSLAELKLLDKKINKKINESVFVDYKTNKNQRALKNQKTVQEFESDAKSNYESIITLIKNRQKIKSAILLSNHKTKVKIGKIEMTVVEAIERKNSIVYEKHLLTEMKKNFIQCKNDIENTNKQIEAQVLKLLETNLGKDRVATKEDYEKISKPFREDNELQIIDPIGVEKIIEKLENDIMEFESEVDFVLSESNAKTTIDIEL